MATVAPPAGQVGAPQLRLRSGLRDFGDIAITPGGPMLVEGNGAPDLDIMQRFIRHGLMATRLGVLLAFHVSQLGLDQLPLT